MAYVFNPFTGNFDAVDGAPGLGLTAGGVVFSDGSTLAVDATNFQWDDTDNTLIIGDPGTEGSGVNVNGVTYQARLKISDIGTTNPAMHSLHRHSTTIPAVTIASRSNSDTSAHASVTTAMSLYQIYASGWSGSHYDLACAISFETGAGTISATSMPGKIRFYTTPNGSNTLAERLSIDQSGLATFTDGVTITGTTTLATALTGVLKATSGVVSTGSIPYATRTITGNLTVDTTTRDDIIFCNQSGAISITFPAPASNTGRILYIKDISGTAQTNNITLVRNASEKIEGRAASKALQTNWGSWTITTNGTDWFMI